LSEEREQERIYKKKWLKINCWLNKKDVVSHWMITRQVLIILSPTRLINQTTIKLTWKISYYDLYFHEKLHSVSWKGFSDMTELIHPNHKRTICDYYRIQSNWAAAVNIYKLFFILQPQNKFVFTMHMVTIWKNRKKWKMKIIIDISTFNGLNTFNNLLIV
jgi:hypothetical protein